MAKLSQCDLEIHHSMKVAGVLEHVNGHRLNAPHGVVIVSCSGPYERSKDIIEHKADILFDCFGHRNIFPVLVPGGALRLWKRSPTNLHGRSLHTDLIDMIAFGMKALSTDIVELYVHGPCVCAHDAHVSYLEEHDILFKAKEFVKQKIRETRVACYTHIDLSDEYSVEMNTYFVRRANYYPWRQNLRLPLVTAS